MKLKAFLIIAFLFSLFIFRRTEYPKRTSFIFDSDCVAPCWYEIHPGKTLETDVLTKVEEISTRNPGTIYSRGAGNLPNDVISLTSKSGENVNIYFWKDTVSLINFAGNLDCTFGEAVEMFGDPEYLLWYQTRGSVFLFFDRIHLFVFGIIPSRGIAYGFDLFRIFGYDSFDLKPSNKLLYIGYFDVDEFERVKNIMLFPSSGRNSTSIWDVMQSWDGYGELMTKYPRKVP